MSIHFGERFTCIAHYQNNTGSPILGTFSPNEAEQIKVIFDRLKTSAQGDAVILSQSPETLTDVGISRDDIIQVPLPRYDSNESHKVAKLKIYTDYAEQKDASAFRIHHAALNLADKLAPSSPFKLDSAGDYARAKFFDDTDPVISFRREGSSYGDEVPGER